MIQINIHDDLTYKDITDKNSLWYKTVNCKQTLRNGIPSFYTEDHIDIWVNPSEHCLYRRNKETLPIDKAFYKSDEDDRNIWRWDVRGAKEGTYFIAPQNGIITVAYLHFKEDYFKIIENYKSEAFVLDAMLNTLQDIFGKDKIVMEGNDLIFTDTKKKVGGIDSIGYGKELVIWSFMTIDFLPFIDLFKAYLEPEYLMRNTEEYGITGIRDELQEKFSYNELYKIYTKHLTDGYIKDISYWRT